MNNKGLLFAFIISSLLSVLVSFLSNLASTYLAPSFASQPYLIYGALVVTFIISLPISYYLLSHSEPTGLPKSEGPQISQTAKSKGRIEGSPVKVSKEIAANVDQQAENEGAIKNSGVIID